MQGTRRLSPGDCCRTSGRRHPSRPPESLAEPLFNSWQMGKAPVPCPLLLLGTCPATPFGRHVPRGADGLSLPSTGLMSLIKKASQSLPWVTAQT